jgi:hypothetical protein
MIFDRVTFQLLESYPNRASEAALPGFMKPIGTVQRLWL